MFTFQFKPIPEHAKCNRNNKKLKDNQELETPDYFNFIDEDDQNRYRELQKILISPENRYARNRRVETLKESIEEIRKFCLRDDENDWKRCLVCGVIWLKVNKCSNDVDSKNKKNNTNENECISINIRQLKIILGKSKSTINGAMAKMGYVTFPTKGNDQDLLIDAMPYFEGKYFEMRQWTIRKRDINQNEKETKQAETKTTEEETIPFISFEDNENDDFRFGEIDLNDHDFWFNHNFDKNMYDLTIINCKEDSSNIYFTSSNIDFKNINSLVCANVESILEINNVRQVTNMCKSNFNKIINNCISILTLMIMSTLFQYYLTYMKTIMALEAGRRIPRLVY